MKVLRKNKLLIVLVLAVFAVISAACSVFAFDKKSVNAESLVSSTFEMESGVSAKLSNGGGIRFRVKMDEETKNNIVNDDRISLEFIVAPSLYFENGVAEDKNVTIPVDKTKIYGDGNGYFYANGCITEIKSANRTLEFKAIARIKKDGAVVDKTVENDLARNNLYDVLNSAVLATSGNYENTIAELPAYSEWLGSENFPIKISDNADYAKFIAKSGGQYYRNKHYVVDTAVTDYNESDLRALSGVTVKKLNKVVVTDALGVEAASETFALDLNGKISAESGLVTAITVDGVAKTFATAAYKNNALTLDTETVKPLNGKHDLGATVETETAVGTIISAVSFEIDVLHAAPALELHTDGNYEECNGIYYLNRFAKNLSVSGGTYALPQVLASADGDDIKDSVSVEYSNESMLNINGANITPDIGYCAVTYTAVNPYDSSKVTTKTLHVNIYREVIDWQDGTWSYIEGFKHNAKEQTVKTNTNGFQLMRFNMSASEYYYAEATFKTAGRVGAGIANYAQNETGRALVSVVPTSGNADYKFVDFRADEGKWTLQENDKNGNQIAYRYQITNEDTLTALPKDGDLYVTKMAVLRIGDMFSAFYNDQYVAATDMSHYASQETIPGMFVSGFEGATDYVTGIDYYFGTEAEMKSKFNTLTHNGKDIIRQYFYSDSKNTDNCNFTVNDTTDERGINFDFTANNKLFNGGCVSPYLFFDGDFTFSWEYKATSVTTGSENPRMILELRSIYAYRNEYNGAIQFGAHYNADASLNRILLNAAGLYEGNGECYKWNEPALSASAPDGCRFTISRKICDGYAEITMTATSLNDPSVSVTRTVQIGETADKTTGGHLAYEDWNDPVVVMWHNTNVAGEYSNITWSGSAN